MIALWTMVWIWSRLIIGHLELTAAPLVCFYDTTNYEIETGYFFLNLDWKIIFSVWYGRLKRKGISVIIALVPGALAQLVERCVRNAEIRGSNPLCSTRVHRNSVKITVGFLFLGAANLYSAVALSDWIRRVFAVERDSVRLPVMLTLILYSTKNYPVKSSFYDSSFPFRIQLAL